MECMDDDFNTAGAMGNLFDLVRVINQARADGATDNQLKEAQDSGKRIDRYSWLHPFEKTGSLAGRTVYRAAA